MIHMTHLSLLILLLIFLGAVLAVAFVLKKVF